MKLRHISLNLATVVLMLAGHPAWAADTQAAAPQAAASKTRVKLHQTKPKVLAKVKLVDINSANRTELTKLPGIDDAAAAKIIAGRPYGSKAWLVTNNIIEATVYEGLKQQVIAKQPSKDAAKNAAWYKKK